MMREYDNAISGRLAVMPWPERPQWMGADSEKPIWGLIYKNHQAIIDMLQHIGHMQYQHRRRIFVEWCHQYRPICHQSHHNQSFMPMKTRDALAIENLSPWFYVLKHHYKLHDMRWYWSVIYWRYRARPSMILPTFEAALHFTAMWYAATHQSSSCYSSGAASSN